MADGSERFLVKGPWARRKARDFGDEVSEDLIFANNPSEIKNTSVRKKCRADCNAVSSKVPIKHLYDVISKFCPKKKALVVSIGFGGLLQFPPIRQFNRRFGLWVMSEVDPHTRTLVIDSSRSMTFDKEDVARVFGIPCKGMMVSQLAMTQDEVIRQVMDGYLSLHLRDHMSIKAAQEVIDRDYGNIMSTDEENSFKAAFLIYVVSILLAPGAKYDHTLFDYWDALVNPNSIHLFDWCEYVIHRLCDAVVKVRVDLRSGSKVATITGCSLFLQVFYLDSIDIGVLNMEHKTYPRVQHFGQSIMRSMILADTLPEIEDMTECSFGKSKLRAASEVTPGRCNLAVV